jgi:hypothetical protein
MRLDNSKLPSNKKFGYFFSVVFLIAATYFFYSKNQSLGYFLIILALLFIIAAFVNAKFLSPLNKLWMSLGLLLGKIISPIVLGFIFFVFFTSYAIIMRIMGRDQLRLKIKNNQSYWTIRSNSNSKTNFKEQF